MNKKHIKNFIVMIALILCSCKVQDPNNAQISPKSQSMGKIIYSSSFNFEARYMGNKENNYTDEASSYTKTYIYDVNSSKLLKETTRKQSEYFYKWSFDGSKILAYRKDYDKKKNSIVIYDVMGNEIDKIETPEPESDSIWLNNSNKILFRTNNSDLSNPNLELMTYDSASKTSKKISGTESSNFKKFWSDLSLDDDLIFITEQSSEKNNESDNINSKTSIFTFNINNGQKTLVTEFNGVNLLIKKLKWHPLDKTKFLAILGDGDIYIININTKEKTLISSKDKRKDPEINFSLSSNEVFIYSGDKTTLLNLDTKEEIEYSGKLLWTCDKEIFLLKETDGIYKTDRKMNKKELIIKRKTDALFGSSPIDISDINCFQK